MGRAIRQRETVVIAAGEWELINITNDTLPWCWFWVCPDKGFEAEFRNDSKIYRSGHKTKDAAVKYGEKQGFI